MQQTQEIHGLCLYDGWRVHVVITKFGSSFIVVSCNNLKNDIYVFPVSR